MKAALTGGSGFVGSHLLERLVAEGWEVAALARTPAAADAVRAQGASVVPGDLDDTHALAALVRGAEVAFHVAGVVAAPSDDVYLRVNKDGSARLAEVLSRAGDGLLVLVSSLSASGPSERGRPHAHAGPPTPVSRYGRSKAEGEQAVRASGVRCVCVRPPAVYGPRDRELLRLFKLARLGVTPLLGDGRQELSLIHVRDLAEALVAAARARACEGRVYHAAGPERVTQAELCDLVGQAVSRRVRKPRLARPIVRLLLGASGAWARLAGRASLLAPDKAPELLAPAWTCASTDLERDSGWRARHALAAGLRETAEAYRAAGWL